MVGHDELKAADNAKELKPPKMGTMNFMEDLYTSNDLKATKDSYDSSRMAKETEFDPIRSHMDADDGRRIKATNNLDAPMKKAMDLPRDQGFTNGITSVESVTYPDEPKIQQERDVVQQKTDGHNVKGLDGIKLVKDIEEMKLKVDALESKLKQVSLSNLEVHYFSVLYVTVLKS